MKLFEDSAVVVEVVVVLVLVEKHSRRGYRNGRSMHYNVKFQYGTQRAQLSHRHSLVLCSRAF